jgi:hypothetical protein
MLEPHSEYTRKIQGGLYILNPKPINYKPQIIQVATFTHGGEAFRLLGKGWLANYILPNGDIHIGLRGTSDYFFIFLYQNSNQKSKKNSN